MQADGSGARHLVTIASAFAIVAWASCVLIAHKPITSRFDYNRDVYPLLRDNCGPCHAERGPAPMSLMTYQDAVPWAEAIREELTSGRMPPWPVEPSGPTVRGARVMAARDIDTIVTWASGGTPVGEGAIGAEAPAFQPRWSLGPPDLELPMPAAHVIPAGRLEEVVDLWFDTTFPGPRWIKSVDLLPGTASVVRDAVISVDGGSVLGLWQPGDRAVAAPAGAAFELPPSGRIHLQLHYRKPFDQESRAVADRSAVGLYFSSRADVRIEAASIEPAGGLADAQAPFAADLPRSIRILAIRPMLDAAYRSVAVDAVGADGSRRRLLALQGPRPAWFRRYWLDDAIDLGRGTRLEVHVVPFGPQADEPKAAARFALHVDFDYIAPD